MGFVRVEGGRLVLDGEPFAFVGTNCYYLQEEGARELLGWEGFGGRVEEAFRKVSRLGLPVVRAWAFNDDPENPAAMQVAPLVPSEAGLRGMDLVLETAARHGVRLVLSLGNYWSDYGGVRQYLLWHGLDPSRPERFFRDEAVVSHYAEHVERLMGRKSTRTGLRWGEDPTVLAWELLNEPRGAGLGDRGEALAAWVDRLATRLRGAARQLVATGEEGFADDLAGRAGPEVPPRRACQSFGANAAAVDLASIHLYPEAWGFRRGAFAEAGARWIATRADEAARLGRPLVVGEVGLRNEGLPLAERRRIYEAWLEAALAHEAVSGVCSWTFSTDDRPDDWDEHTWRLRSGTDEADPANRYADLHRRWAARFARKGRPTPRPDGA